MDVKNNFNFNLIQVDLLTSSTNFMKNLFTVFFVTALLHFTSCVRQRDLPAPDQSIAEKPSLPVRYPTTPDEIALVENLSKVTDIFKLLYQDNANVKLVNASIYARVFPDETVLLGDLIFPSQSRLTQFSRFDSLSRAWGVDLNIFARQFWREVSMRNDSELEQFLQSLAPSILSGNQYAVDNGTAPPVSVYFPYSETFSPSSGGTYLPTVSLLSATADTDEGPGSEPQYVNGSLTGYVPVTINDLYASSHATHVIGVNGPEEPASGPGGGCCVTVFGPPLPPGPPPPVYKRAPRVENIVLKEQYDNLISFTGNGGGSEVRVNRVSAHLQPTVGSSVSSFAPLVPPFNAPASYVFSQSTVSHTRQEIAGKVWKKTVGDEARWDTNWVESNFEQALAVWEYDNTNSRSFFSGQLMTTLLQNNNGSPLSLVSGVKSYSVGVPSNHPPIRHLRISRQNYFSQARVNTGFGYREGPLCSVWSGHRDAWYYCYDWTDYAGVISSQYSSPNLEHRWPAYEVHWETKAGAVFGWTWPNRTYYVGRHPTEWVY
jgi:hypothetical protein